MAFTTGSLATFLVTTLGATGVALGLTVASPAVVDAVAEFEAVLGVATADVGDDLKTRIVGRWLAWRTALGAATGYTHLEAGSAKIWQSESFDHILMMLRDAEAAAQRYPEVAVIIAGSSTGYVSEMVTGGPYASSSCAGEW